jgi:hypothetical protein
VVTRWARSLSQMITFAENLPPLGDLKPNEHQLRFRWRRRGRLAIVLWGLLGTASISTIASAQTVTTTSAFAPRGQTTLADQADNTGADFARPISLFQLMYQYRTAPGNGVVKGTTREVTTDTLNLRLDRPFNLAAQWVLATRADLPLLAKNPIGADNPTGDYVSGVGDADVQAALIHTIDDRWKVGFGARLVAPTGGDVLGSGKWQILPIVGARYAWPELSSGSYLEPLLRYDESFAGNPSKRNIGNLQFAPTLNVGLPDKWFVAFYPSPDIRVNFSDRVPGQTGRLFVPFDARITRRFSDSLAASLEIGVPIIRQYPVYDFKTQLRINMSF